MTVHFPRLTEIERKLDTIFREAGPDMDLSQVKSLGSDDEDKLAAIQSLNDELETLRRTEKAVEAYQAGNTAYGESGFGGADDRAGAWRAGARATGRGLKGVQVLTKTQSVKDWTVANGVARDLDADEAGTPTRRGSCSATGSRG